MEVQNQSAHAETNNTAADLISLSSDVKHCSSAAASSCCHHQACGVIRTSSLYVDKYIDYSLLLLPVK